MFVRFYKHDFRYSLQFLDHRTVIPVMYNTVTMKILAEESFDLELNNEKNNQVASF